MSETLKQVLIDVGQETGPDGKTALYGLVEVIWTKALAGDFRFVKLLTDRLEGRPYVAVVDVPQDTTGRDEAISISLLRIYGPVSAEDRRQARAEMAEMEQLREQLNGS